MEDRRIPVVSVREVRFPIREWHLSSFSTTLTITTKIDYFGKLNKILIKYKDKGDFLFVGDLNARIGSEDSLHEKLGNQQSHLLPDIEATSLETDNNCTCDNKVNTSGRKLLTIYK